MREFNVNSIFYRVFSPTFISVPETFCVVELPYQNFIISVISVNLIVNYTTDDLNKAIFVISDSKSTSTNVLFFDFLQILVLTFFSVFSADILDERYEPKTLVFDSIESIELKSTT